MHSRWARVSPTSTSHTPDTADCPALSTFWMAAMSTPSFAVESTCTNLLGSSGVRWCSMYRFAWPLRSRTRHTSTGRGRIGATFVATEGGGVKD